MKLGIKRRHPLPVVLLRIIGLKNLGPVQMVVLYIYQVLIVKLMWRIRSISSSAHSLAIMLRVNIRLRGEQFVPIEIHYLKTVYL